MSTIKIVNIILYILIAVAAISSFFIDDVVLENKVLRIEIIMWILVSILSKSTHEVDKHTNDTN